jgi:alpha-L-fucosidase
MIKVMAGTPFLFRAQPRYTPDWASLDARPVARWWSDAKFGLLIIWSPDAVPAYAPVHVQGETPYSGWYWRSMEEGKKATNPSQDGYLTWQFHKRNYGADFPFFDFAPMFRAELFDPAQWMDIFVRSGARYILQNTKHHDGFTLWRSEEANRSWGRPWNAVDIGPKRDLVNDISQEGRKRGLKMGIYFSLLEWYNPIWLKDRKRYVAEHLFPQFKDVVRRTEPAAIFADGEWDMTSDEWRTPELLSWLFNDSPVADSVVVNDRWGKETRHRHGGYYTTEYTAGMAGTEHPWEESRGVGLSYPFNRMEQLADYHTGRELILMLVDLVSRGGNFLLSVGPTADGRIPLLIQERLLEIGAWLDKHGEAIYGTHELPRNRQWSAGTVPVMEQKDFGVPYEIKQLVDMPSPGAASIEAFFTAKDDAVYVLLPHRPGRLVRLDGFTAMAGAQATLLASGERLHVHGRGSLVDIEFPAGLELRMALSDLYVIKVMGMRSV